MSVYQQNDDGAWTPAEEIPFYPGIVGRIVEWVKNLFKKNSRKGQ